MTTNPNLNDALRNSCCLLELSTGAPTFKQVDKAASRKADHDHDAKEGTGRVVIYFMNGNDADFNDIKKTQNNLKQFTNMLTFQWGGRYSNSSRKLLANTLFETFITGYKAYHDKIVEIKKRIEFRAPEILRNAVKANGTYNVRLPTPAQLVDSFYVSYAIEPVPQADGFGNVSDVVNQFLKRQFDMHMQESFRNGQADRLNVMRPLVARIIDRMEAFDDREAKKKKGEKPREGTFHGTLLSNVRDLAPALEALNVIGDPGIQSIVDRLTAIKAVDVDDLKKNYATRKVVTDTATNILGDIDKWLKTA